MSFDPVKNAPEWLKRDPVTEYYWVRIFRKGMTPERLSRSTGEKVSKDRAREIGERMIARWMGSEADGSPVQIKFAGVCDELMENLEDRARRGTIRARTLENAKLYISRYLRDEFGTFDVREIKPKTWNQFVAQFHKDHPGKTLYSHWKHMAMVMNYALENGYRDEAWKVECPDAKKETGRKLSDDEKRALLNAAEGDLKDELILAMTMGMRLREHLHLTWDRVDFEKQTITLRDGDVKTKKGRVVRISPQALEVLKRRYARRHPVKQSPYVFPSPTNPARPVQQNKTAWRSCKTNAKIKGRLRYHDLRHTFLSDCAKTVKQGQVSLAQVCKYAGLSIKVFESVYLHMDAQDTEDVSKIIGLKLDWESSKKETSL